MTMRLESFGSSLGVLERLIRRRLIRREDPLVKAAAALLRSFGFEKVTVVFEQP